MEDATLAAIYDDVLANPDDPLPKFAYADWVDENKPEWADIAYAFRWMASHKKHPRVTAKKQWAFWRPQVRGRFRFTKVNLGPDSLPNSIFLALPHGKEIGGIGERGCYRSERGAFVALASAISGLRKDIALG